MVLFGVLGGNLVGIVLMFGLVGVFVWVIFSVCIKVYFGEFV